MADRRFPTSFKDVPDADEPGLVLGDDDVVYLVKPDASRVAVGGGSNPFVGAFVGRIATISLSPDSATQVTFDQVLYDTDGFFDQPDGGIILIPAGLGGLYRASALAIFNDTGTSSASWVHLEIDMGLVPGGGSYVAVAEQMATDDIGSTTVSLTSPVIPMPENQTIDMYVKCQSAVDVIGNLDAHTWDQLILCIERLADLPTVTP